MKIEFPNNDQEYITKTIKDFNLIKFAVFKRMGYKMRDMVLLLFSEESTHYDMVKRRLERKIADEEFIGAGFIHGIRFANWDSELCKKHIGHDRPDIMDIQALALGEIRKAVCDLV